MHIYYLLNITKGTQSSMIFFDPVTFKKNVKKKQTKKHKTKKEFFEFMAWLEHTTRLSL